MTPQDAPCGLYSTDDDVHAAARVVPAQGRTGALVGHLERAAQHLLAVVAELRGGSGIQANDVDESASSMAMNGAVISPHECPPSVPATTRRLLSVGDVAERLGVDPKTVRRWRQDGQLPPAIDLGSVLRWRPEDIALGLAERQEVQP